MFTNFQLVFAYPPPQVKRPAQKVGIIGRAPEVQHRLVHRRWPQAMREGLASQIAQVRQAVDADETRTASRQNTVPRRSRADRPELFIKARLARGSTPADLAQRLNLKPQPIQRYEATRCRFVRFERLRPIARALDGD